MNVLLSRIIGALVAGLVGWLVVKYGIDLSPATTEQLVTSIVGVVMAMLAAFGVVHKAVDAKVNPGDAATPTLAAQEKVEQQKLTGQL